MADRHTRLITANRLTDGAVVYLDWGSQWTERSLAARTFADASEEARLVAVATTDPAVVDVHVADADAALRPLTLRERIRRDGPTVRPDLLRA